MNEDRAAITASKCDKLLLAGCETGLINACVTALHLVSIESQTQAAAAIKIN